MLRNCRKEGPMGTMQRRSTVRIHSVTMGFTVVSRAMAVLATLSSVAATPAKHTRNLSGRDYHQNDVADSRKHASSPRVGLELEVGAFRRSPERTPIDPPRGRARRAAPPETGPDVDDTMYMTAADDDDDDTPSSEFGGETASASGNGDGPGSGMPLTCGENGFIEFGVGCEEAAKALSNAASQTMLERQLGYPPPYMFCSVLPTLLVSQLWNRWNSSYLVTPGWDECTTIVEYLNRLADTAAPVLPLSSTLECYEPGWPGAEVSYGQNVFWRDTTDCAATVAALNALWFPNYQAAESGSQKICSALSGEDCGLADGCAVDPADGMCHETEEGLMPGLPGLIPDAPGDVPGFRKHVGAKCEYPAYATTGSPEFPALPNSNAARTAIEYEDKLYEFTVSPPDYGNGVGVCARTCSKPGGFPREQANYRCGGFAYSSASMTCTIYPEHRPAWSSCTEGVCSDEPPSCTAGDVLVSVPNAPPALSPVVRTETKTCSMVVAGSWIAQGFDIEAEGFYTNDAAGTDASAFTLESCKAACASVSQCSALRYCNVGSCKGLCQFPKTKTEEGVPTSPDATFHIVDGRNWKESDSLDWDCFTKIDSGAKQEQCPLAASVCIFSNVSCYSDAMWPMGLGAHPSTMRTWPASETNSRSECARKCAILGRNVVAVRGGTECYCSYSFPDASTQVANAKCDGIVCPGDASETCGGVVVDDGVTGFDHLNLLATFRSTCAPGPSPSRQKCCRPAKRTDGVAAGFSCKLFDGSNTDNAVYYERVASSAVVTTTATTAVSSTESTSTTPCFRGTASQTGLKPCAECPSDTYSSVTSTKCVPCPAGHHSTSGSTKCTTPQPTTEGTGSTRTRAASTHKRASVTRTFPSTTSTSATTAPAVTATASAVNGSTSWQSTARQDPVTGGLTKAAFENESSSSTVPTTHQHSRLFTTISEATSELLSTTTVAASTPPMSKAESHHSLRLMPLLGPILAAAIVLVVAAVAGRRTRLKRRKTLGDADRSRALPKANKKDAPSFRLFTNGSFDPENLSLKGALATADMAPGIAPQVLVSSSGGEMDSFSSDSFSSHDALQGDTDTLASLDGIDLLEVLSHSPSSARDGGAGPGASMASMLPQAQILANAAFEPFQSTALGALPVKVEATEFPRIASATLPSSPSETTLKAVHEKTLNAAELALIKARSIMGGYGEVGSAASLDLTMLDLCNVNMPLLDGPGLYDGEMLHSDLPELLASSGLSPIPPPRVKAELGTGVQMPIIPVRAHAPKRQVDTDVKPRKQTMEEARARRRNHMRVTRAKEAKQLEERAAEVNILAGENVNLQQTLSWMREQAEALRADTCA